VQSAPLAAALAQRGVEALALQVDHLLRRVQLECDVGMLGVPIAHARQQPALGKRRQHADAQPLLRARGRGGGRAHAVVDLVERGADRPQQRRACRVEHDASCAPVEQLEAELGLEQAQLLADRAVRQVQLVGRSAQVAGARDHAKARQRVQGNARHGRHSLPTHAELVDSIGSGGQLSCPPSIRRTAWRPHFAARFLSPAPR